MRSVSVFVSQLRGVGYKQSVDDCVAVREVLHPLSLIGVATSILVVVVAIVALVLVDGSVVLIAMLGAVVVVAVLGYYQTSKEYYFKHFNNFVSGFFYVILLELE